MSYQAITDIIVNQNQFSDLQLSSTLKDSPDLNSSVSFAGILASLNHDENKIEEPEKVEAENVNEAVKSEKIENTSDNKVEDEEKAGKISENDEKKTEKETAEADVEDKNDVKSKITAKNESDTEVKGKTEDSEADKKTAKTQKDKGNDKKLTDKDFARLDEVTNSKTLEEDTAKQSLAAQNNIRKEDLSDIKNDEENDASQLKIDTDTSSEIAFNQINEKERESSDLNFSENNEKGSRKFSLDKEGKITVEDQRTKIENENTDDSKKPVIKTSEIKLTNDSTAVMSVELNPNAEADVLSLNTQTAASNGSNFQAMLSNQLSNVAPEFVKAGNLVLKDNNQGTINLVLHPDDLGNVKIHLSLDGKTLSGHITVATKEALQVFKDNAETLREAFIKSGFDSASFDVAMNNGGSFNQNMGFNGQDDGRNLFAKRLYGNAAGGLSSEFDDIFDNVEDISNYSVNIVA